MLAFSCILLPRKLKVLCFSILILFWFYYPNGREPDKLYSSISQVIILCRDYVNAQMQKVDINGHIYAFKFIGCDCCGDSICLFIVDIACNLFIPQNLEADPPAVSTSSLCWNIYTLLIGLFIRLTVVFSSQIIQKRNLDPRARCNHACKEEKNAYDPTHINSYIYIYIYISGGIKYSFCLDLPC